MAKAETKRFLISRVKFYARITTLLGILTIPIIVIPAEKGLSSVTPFLAVAMGTVIAFAAISLRDKTTRRRLAVEREMTAALGLPSEPRRHTEVEAEQQKPAMSEESPPTPEKDEPEQAPQQIDRPNYAQHVQINVASEAATTEIADLVRQQSDGHARLVIKYYAQGHTQASIGFFLSMTFAVVGFALIAIALVQLLQQPDQPLTAGVTGFVGAVNQAVSILFFRRADKGRDLMMQLIDKLRTDRESEMKFVAGLAAIEQVKAGGLQDALRAAAALTFTSSSMNVEQLGSLVNSGALAVEGANRTPHINVFGPQGREARVDENGQDPQVREQPKSSG